MTDLTKIKEALEGATEGMWLKCGDATVSAGGKDIAYLTRHSMPGPELRANLHLFVSAPDMARLCIEQAAEIERLRAALNFIADLEETCE